MTRIITGTLISALMAGGLFAITPPASAADVTVGVNAGGIAFGYSDGYWDRDHNWHTWKNREETEHFRMENHDHYYERKHDADKTMGWRDERWWDRH